MKWVSIFFCVCLICTAFNFKWGIQNKVLCNIAETDTIRGNVKLITSKDIKYPVLFADSILGNMLSAKDIQLPFDTDSAYTIDNVEQSNLPNKIQVYMLSGSILPSKSAYKLALLCKNKKICDYHIIAQPVDVEIILGKYEVSQSAIQIWGADWDEVSGDNFDSIRPDSILLEGK